MKKPRMLCLVLGAIVLATCIVLGAIHDASRSASLERRAAESDRRLEQSRDDLARLMR